MIRSIALSAVIALGTAGAALAQSAPQLVGGGEDSAVVYAAPSANVVGGGRVQIFGGGENRSFQYGGVQAQEGRDVAVIGGGEDRQFRIGTAGRPVILAQSLATTHGR